MALIFQRVPLADLPMVEHMLMPQVELLS
ncbi:hypothetical protein NC651_040183 [Populus alba x Populus x berolinensis]|nr:hypothetical protein NC651_040183 [Populus alba x Populus x berolinensis]